MGWEIETGKRQPGDGSALLGMPPSPDGSDDTPSEDTPESPPDESPPERSV
jgi:hypothetical protein